MLVVVVVVVVGVVGVVVVVGSRMEASLQKAGT